MRNRKLDEVLENQRKLELRIRELYISNAPIEEIQKAYDDFHSFIMNHGVRGEMMGDYVYKAQLSIIDNILLKCIGKGKSVLEIGAGDGHFLVACVRNENETVGIDISLFVLKKLEAKLNRKKLNIQLRFGDARHLEFPNAKFDYVVSKDLVEHIPSADLQHHLREVWRVLKPKGCYLVWTPSRLLGPTSLGTHLREYTLAELLSEFKRAHFDPYVLSLHVFVVSRKPVTIPKSIIPVIVNYEKILGAFLKLVHLPSQHPFLYVVVPPICIAARKIGLHEYLLDRIEE
jgi:ubiquinone/menaquinone biosynthesis C-methylase UbiE